MISRQQHPKSLLEIQREENIARNEAFLAKLDLGGLNSSIFPTMTTTISTSSSRKRPRMKSITTSDTTNGENAEISPPRRSTRSKISSFDPNKISSASEDEPTHISASRRKPSRVERIKYDDNDTSRNPISNVSLQNFIQASNASHDEEISDKAIYHCVDRIHSMSNEALATRIKGISSGRGKVSREKLLVFYYALKMCGLDQLAHVAARNLQLFGIKVPEQEE